MKRCATCDLTIAASGLRAQAATLDALDRPEDGAQARAEADRLDSLGCSWWWRRKVESLDPNPDTGQHEERVVEGCGKLALPSFLSDFGWSTRMAAQSVQTATGQAARAAEGAERVAVAVDRLEAGIAAHGRRVEIAASTVGGLLLSATAGEVSGGSAGGQPAAVPAVEMRRE